MLVEVKLGLFQTTCARASRNTPLRQSQEVSEDGYSFSSTKETHFPRQKRLVVRQKRLAVQIAPKQAHDTRRSYMFPTHDTHTFYYVPCACCCSPKIRPRHSTIHNKQYIYTQFCPLPTPPSPPPSACVSVSHTRPFAGAMKWSPGEITHVPQGSRACPNSKRATP